MTKVKEFWGEKRQEWKPICSLSQADLLSDPSHFSPPPKEGYRIIPMGPWQLKQGKFFSAEYCLNFKLLRNIQSAKNEFVCFVNV